MVGYNERSVAVNYQLYNVTGTYVNCYCGGPKACGSATCNPATLTIDNFPYSVGSSFYALKDDGDYN